MGFERSAARGASILCAMVLYSIAARAQGAQPAHQPNVGYVPTSDEAVQAMLKLAGVTKSDVVYDLGCGDGRIVITAAKVYGARGVGIDIDPQRIAEANANAEAAGVRDLVRFEEKDLFEADIHDASVVTLFLLSSINLRLRPKLLHDLKPGTRVVSNTFGMGDWKPARKLMVKTKGPGDFFSHQLLMWIVPSPAR